MKNIKVKNGKVDGFKKGIYIGRKGYGLRGNALANPFKIGKDGNREVVVKKYRRWLWEEICKGNYEVIKELEKLKEKAKKGEEINLICWCYPKTCHGDVIKACLEWMINEAKD